MQSIDLQDEKKAILIEAGNSNLELIGGEIQTAFIEEVSPKKGSIEEGLADVEYGEGIRIRVRPELEIGERRTLRMHLPRDVERSIGVKVGNGGINVEELKGHLDLAISNGRMKLKNIGGSVTATTANGSISCEGLESQIDLSTSNGRITVRRSSIKGGTIKSGSGRIHLQIKPDDAGSLSVFSGNGKVRLALGDQEGFRLQIRTKGKLYNHLESYTVQTEQDATILEKGSGAFTIFVQNYRGGVSLMKYEDFDKDFEEEGWFDEFEDWCGPGEFFQNVFGRIDPEKWGNKISKEFEREIPRFMEGMARFGQRFGRMGEEVSRQFHEAQSKSDREVTIVLDMLKEGKISAEEAERLIRAIREKGHRE
jgi:hypothetical protein